LCPSELFAERPQPVPRRHNRRREEEEEEEDEASARSLVPSGSWRQSGTVMPMTDAWTLPEVGELRERRIHSFVRDLARNEDLWLDSCLDVGCGRSRYDQWFERFERNRRAGHYIGLETDPMIMEELRTEGVDVRHALDGPGYCVSDLTLALEVIEHVLPEDTPAFMKFIAENTRKLLVLTTPNFEYWNGNRPRPEYRECRWIPDHMPTFNPTGGPHHHKQAMTPETLRNYFVGAFPAPEWKTRVFRAWPWRIEDQVSGEAWELYFKLFAVAWRRPPAGGIDPSTT